MLAGNGEQELSAPGASTVATREDADTQVFILAKQRIEERLAGRRQTGPSPTPDKESFYG
jgi:hypothetical protein